MIEDSNDKINSGTIFTHGKGIVEISSKLDAGFFSKKGKNQNAPDIRNIIKVIEETKKEN